MGADRQAAAPRQSRLSGRQIPNYYREDIDLNGALTQVNSLGGHPQPSTEPSHLSSCRLTRLEPRPSV